MERAKLTSDKIAARRELRKADQLPSLVRFSMWLVWPRRTTRAAQALLVLNGVVLALLAVEAAAVWGWLGFHA